MTKGEGRVRGLLSSRDQLGRKAIFRLPGLGCACEVRDRVQPQDICWGLRMGEGGECQEKEEGEERAVSTSYTEFLSARTLVLDHPLLLVRSPFLLKRPENHTGAAVLTQQLPRSMFSSFHFLIKHSQSQRRHTP